MTKDGKEIKDFLFNCPKQGFEVHLKVKGEVKKGFFGNKFVDQEVKKCDLQSQGGCTIKIEPAVSSNCPAVIKAQKSGLK